MNEFGTYGMVAEFDDPTALLEAAHAIKREGYRKIEAYTPYSIKDLEEIIPGGNLVPPIVLIGGL
ncbi:MAG: DUF3341 domain-containing protein, partial [Acidobacteriaceae bacterium]|nr:DUF3341 domain-containing protein [Acidobacteriaceae bacterium]